MPNEPHNAQDNPFESPKQMSVQARGGSPTLRIVAVIFLSIATAIALPIVFVTVCIAVAIGGDSISGLNEWVAIAAGALLATLAVGLLVFGMIRLGMWLLRARPPQTQ